MMNQDNPYAMNQTCKVCGEPAAGFHFGAFTCEGCKSFFGRSYNNLSSISDCKNNGECIINKKNRTACKACRLRKCLMVGMSKSGSRYGRRSNWFKIHCLLQEQQQQAAAAMAAHQNQHQQQASHHHQTVPGGMHVKPPGIPPPSAAAAALGMLGHAGAYPGLYPPRTKEEIMMLSLEEYSKHSVASPAVSSPDSHNSDSSVEVNGRSMNSSLLHLSAKHGGLDTSASSVGGSTTGPAVPHPLRKDLPPFLPLSFPALSSMPVMPPPSFLPPSHLLFPGYHPALYQHAHAGLLKPSPEQQAAAAAMHHLFQNSSRFPTTPLGCTEAPSQKPEEKSESPRSDSMNNNHIPNGSKAAEELTKRFYLDAVLKSQQSQTPPPPQQSLLVTKLPNLSKHDHSITALVTPNSESGRAHNTSRQSNEDEEDEKDKNRDTEKISTNENLSNGHDSSEALHNTEEDDDDEEEDLVVSMTPPRSPIELIDCPNSKSDTMETSVESRSAPAGQDNPIDLSMKAASSVSSSVSAGSECSMELPKRKPDQTSDHENDLNDSNDKTHDLWKTHEIIKNSVNNNNNESDEHFKDLEKVVKRKLEAETTTQIIDNELPRKLAKLESSVLDLTTKI